MRHFIESVETRKDAKRRRLNRWLELQLKGVADPKPIGQVVFCGESFHEFGTHVFVYGSKESRSTNIAYYNQMVSFII
jgi:hypothetical protein